MTRGPEAFETSVGPHRERGGEADGDQSGHPRPGALGRAGRDRAPSVREARSGVPEEEGSYGSDGPYDQEDLDRRPVDGDARSHSDPEGREDEDLNRRGGNRQEVVGAREHERGRDNEKRDPESDGPRDEDPVTDRSLNVPAREKGAHEGEGSHQEERPPEADRARGVRHAHAGAGVVGPDAEREGDGCRDEERGGEGISNPVTRARPTSRHAWGDGTEGRASPSPRGAHVPRAK